MEKRINQQIEQYMTTFKDDIKSKVCEMNLDNKLQAAELISFVYDYNRLCLSKDDFVKRKRVKNAVPVSNRCNAKRASGEQCTRRRKKDCDFCGTHFKGTPHGLVSAEGETENIMQKMEVFAEDIKGIVYYIDKFNNVYQTEDILANKENPRIIAKAEKLGETYTIKAFGLV
jgi:hypothetical protein